MFRALTATIVFCAAGASAQEMRTTIVLDGSGSMWGQIEGEAKITIARRALGTLLEQMGEERQLGLVAYGHRERGACGDIETLVAPGPGTAEAIRTAVDGVSPKGKTPLSDAVLHAAEGLAFTEEAATVILISDGIETCDADPCAVGRRLEETGVDFTAHVIGFDVDGAAAEQLACLANETGGRFVLAENAEGLAEALQSVAAEAPAPVEGRLDLSAIVEGAADPLAEGVVWTVTSDNGVLAPDVDPADSAPSVAVAEGDWRVSALWVETEEVVEDVARVAPEETTDLRLVFAAPVMEASVEGPARATVGSLAEIAWVGPGKGGDFIAVARPDQPGGEYQNYTYTARGNPLELTMPGEPGVYELRYILSEGRKILATQQIEAIAAEVTLTADDAAGVGVSLSVEWTGPDNAGDFITVARPDQNPDAYVNYTYTRRGSPLDLTMPGEAGDYEIRYILAEGRQAIATRPVRVEDVSVSLIAPAQAGVGEALSIEWTGPNNAGDFLTVADPDQPDDAYLNYAYTSGGNPVALTMPGEPGDYELRYILAEGRRAVATRAIRVDEVSVTLNSSPTAGVGAALSVEWTGPDNAGDFITVARGDQPAHEYVGYTYTSKGNPLILTMPTAPGTYELRYILAEGRRAVAVQPISVEDASARLTAPPAASVGSALPVSWEGPSNAGDYITIARPDQAPNQYLGYQYARDGDTVALTMPAEVGDYELRYVMADGSRTLAMLPIRVEPLRATLEAVGRIDAGTNLTVGWDGPDEDGDRIALSDADGAEIVSGAVMEGQANLVMLLPGEPGTYDLAYIHGTTGDVIANRAIILQEPLASLSAPASGDAGETVTVDWAGPAGPRDEIVLVDPEGMRVAFAFTSQGSPAEVTLPDTDGVFELRYVLGQGQRILTTAKIEVLPPEATAPEVRMAVPGASNAGSSIQVPWDGATGTDDRILLVPEGGEPDAAVAEAATAGGSPATLALPDTPGAFEVIYQLGQDGPVLARRPLELR